MSFKQVYLLSSGMKLIVDNSLSEAEVLEYMASKSAHAPSVYSLQEGGVQVLKDNLIFTTFSFKKKVAQKDTIYVNPAHIVAVFEHND